MRFSSFAVQNHSSWEMNWMRLFRDFFANLGWGFFKMKYVMWNFFFFLLTLQYLNMCNNNKILGSPCSFFLSFFLKALMWTQLKKNWHSRTNQGSDPANSYTPPSNLEGPAMPLQKSKANLCYLQLMPQDRSHRPTAGASPRRVRGWHSASDHEPIPLAPRLGTAVADPSCQPSAQWWMSFSARLRLASARLGRLFSRHLAPCPSVCMSIARRK